jgi:hypothetical protein
VGTLCVLQVLLDLNWEFTDFSFSIGLVQLTLIRLVSGNCKIEKRKKKKEREEKRREERKREE